MIIKLPWEAAQLSMPLGLGAPGGHQASRFRRVTSGERFLHYAARDVPRLVRAVYRITRTILKILSWEATKKSGE
jgi:hypothetical protein